MTRNPSRRIKPTNRMTNSNGYGNSHTTRTMTERQPLSPRPPAPPKKKKKSYLWLFGIIAVVVLACAVVYVLHNRMQAHQQLENVTQQMATPTVLIVHPTQGDPHVRLSLPGTVQAEIESSVYAQVSGYIKSWKVDIGAKVKAGDLLAEIDTPVTDQQLKQAQENVGQAQANLNLAKVTTKRYTDLLATHAVSSQDVDNQNANVEVQQANLGAAQAFVSGIEKTEAFKQVRAPIDGVITSRKIDVGDFVSATGQTATTANSNGVQQAGTPTQELFRVAQIDTLRIYVNVPENYADVTTPGIEAKLELASAPNSTVTGKLVRTSNAIDANSLTLLAEIDVPNADGKLLPGGYAQVHFDLVTKHPPLVIPGNTLLFRAQGPQVGVVDTSSNTVHLKDIKIGRDLGTKLEVISGIDENDSIVLNPSDSLTDGQKVQISTDNQPKAN
jgi:membrane fusion protein, multidrug efflux system